YQGESDSDGRSRTELTFYVEGAPVKLHYRFRERQSEAGALMLAVENGVDAIEGLNDQGDVLGTDPDPGIFDVDAQPRRVDLAPDGDAPVRRCEFDCVPDQIDEHLFQLYRITENRRPRRRIALYNQLHLGVCRVYSQHYQAFGQ